MAANVSQPCAVRPPDKEEAHMRYTIAAVGLMIALAFGPAAFAGKDWGDAANGNGYYHVSLLRRHSRT
jgi:hypothetical protein